MIFHMDAKEPGVPDTRDPVVCSTPPKPALERQQAVFPPHDEVEFDASTALVRTTPGDLTFCLDSASYAEAKAAKDEAGWQTLGRMTVREALELWLEEFGETSRKTYRGSMKALGKLELLHPEWSLKQFSMQNHAEVVDQIKMVPYWAESTRQSRAGAYVSFSAYLERRTEGLVRKAIPKRGTRINTFYKIRDTVATKALTRTEWTKFLAALARQSLRDVLVAKLCLQGGKRISEVLELTWDRVDARNREITFFQKKSKAHREITITFPDAVFRDLEALDKTGLREGRVFVTRTGKRVDQRQIYPCFVRAGKTAGIGIRVTPHVMRTTCVTYLMAQGYTTQQIMKITGHSSSEMVDAYNKADQKDNVSKDVSLV